MGGYTLTVLPGSLVPRAQVSFAILGSSGLQMNGNHGLCYVVGIRLRKGPHSVPSALFVAAPTTAHCVEWLNSKIATVQKRAYGFRNLDNFITAIYFHCGGLALWPQRATHREV